MNRTVSWPGNIQIMHAFEGSLTTKTRLAWRRLVAPWFCLRWDGHGCGVARLSSQGWVASQWDTLPANAPLAKTVWLVASERTHFRSRSFPATLIDRKDLPEALMLDIETWSPWGRNSGHFAWPVREGEHWRVAVWVWDQKTEQDGQLAARDQGARITHVMPEQAWTVACFAPQPAPALFVLSESRSACFVVTDARGVPHAQAPVADAAAARRFWRSLGPLASAVTGIINAAGEEASPPWLPELPRHGQPAGKPRAAALAGARIAGVHDWADLQAWRKPLVAGALLLLVWMTGDTLVLLKQEAVVEAALDQARQSAHQVLREREQLQALKARLGAMYDLRRRQGRSLRLLADLTTHLPEQAWLLYVKDDGEAAEIRGKGKNAEHLGAQLEAMPSIAHVAYLADLRPEPASDLEIFQLRLTYAD